MSYLSMDMDDVGISMPTAATVMRKRRRLDPSSDKDVVVATTTTAAAAAAASGDTKHEESKPLDAGDQKHSIAIPPAAGRPSTLKEMLLPLADKQTVQRVITIFTDLCDGDGTVHVEAFSDFYIVTIAHRKVPYDLADMNTRLERISDHVQHVTFYMDLDKVPRVCIQFARLDAALRQRSLMDGTLQCATKRVLFSCIWKRQGIPASIDPRPLHQACASPSVWQEIKSPFDQRMILSLVRYAWEHQGSETPANVKWHLFRIGLADEMALGFTGFQAITFRQLRGFLDLYPFHVDGISVGLLSDKAGPMVYVHMHAYGSEWAVNRARDYSMQPVMVNQYRDFL